MIDPEIQSWTQAYAIALIAQIIRDKFTIFLGQHGLLEKCASLMFWITQGYGVAWTCYMCFGVFFLPDVFFVVNIVNEIEIVGIDISPVPEHKQTEFTFIVL